MLVELHSFRSLFPGRFDSCQLSFASEGSELLLVGEQRESVNLSFLLDWSPRFQHLPTYL